jgi:hypothetical protein
MKFLIYHNLKASLLIQSQYQRLYLTKPFSIAPCQNAFQSNKRIEQNKIQKKDLNVLLMPKTISNNVYSKPSIVLNKYRSYATNSKPLFQVTEGKKIEETQLKKMSTFKKLYSQYGPLFIVVHLITVVLWIYGFFLVSKQYFYSRLFRFQF